WLFSCTCSYPHPSGQGALLQPASACLRSRVGHNVALRLPGDPSPFSGTCSYPHPTAVTARCYSPHPGGQCPLPQSAAAALPSHPMHPQAQ
ncbi:MAG: hypothetical protein KDK99_18015, partial [Verrucomicrobiales bacterium]|nr:hypothetical protein [Verrucomicrobiales bacterium]